MRDGKIRYNTALGQSDEAAGWRKRKTDGGIVMDTTTNEILLDGLAMPHSPQWYNDELWVLESGAGTIGTVDVATKRYQAVAEVPGFTRGLDFCGPVAFVGLSQVSESAVFSGIPITERTQDAPAAFGHFTFKRARFLAGSNSKMRCRKSLRCELSPAFASPTW